MCDLATYKLGYFNATTLCWDLLTQTEAVGEHVDETCHHAHVNVQIGTTQWVDEHVKVKPLMLMTS